MNMASKLALFIFLAMLAANSPTRAGPLGDGFAAFKRHDYAAAGILLRSPAENGNPAAQTILCLMYAYGRGVPQNYYEAASWCGRAANQGSPEAQYMLGIMYNKGHGVPEDFVLAHKWLNLAAARVSGPKRDLFYSLRNAVATKMSPAQISIAQILAIEWKPIPELQRSASNMGKCVSGNKRCPNQNVAVPGHFSPSN